MVNVVIIGAGPAGCELARNLDERFNVFLIDRQKPSRNKVCGGILIEESVEYIQNLNPPKNIFSVPKNLNLVYSDWDNDLEFTQKRKFKNILRKEFDFWLFNLALKKKNVTFCLGTVSLNDINKKQFNVFVDGIKQNIIGDIIIDATGVFLLSRQLNNFKKNVYSAVQFEIDNTFNLDYFNYILDNNISDFYSWLIPKGDMVLCGACLEMNNVSNNIKFFKEKFEKKLGFSFNGAKMSSALIFRPQKNLDFGLVNGKILVVGEAAGLVSPTTGEGISYALRSAKLCANSINKFNSFSEIKDNYIKDSKDLLLELNTKIKKSKAFTNISLRKKYLSTQSD